MIKLYAVKDVKAAFWSPMTCANDAIAMRDFGGFVNHPDVGPVVKDLELWRLGEFDELTGLITSNPEYVCAYRDVVEVKPVLSVVEEVSNECD